MELYFRVRLFFFLDFQSNNRKETLSWGDRSREEQGWRHGTSGSIRFYTSRSEHVERARATVLVHQHPTPTGSVYIYLANLLPDQYEFSPPTLSEKVFCIM